MGGASDARSSSDDAPAAIEVKEDENEKPMALASPVPVVSSTLMSSPPRQGGGLMAAFEERAGLPKQPPPSPATPSAALSIALATGASLPSAREEAREFARAAGAALVQRFAADAELKIGATIFEGSSLPGTPDRNTQDCPGTPVRNIQDRASAV